MLADEVLTPDSSRFWPRAAISRAAPQPSFDKQYVRDYLESIHWNKQPPAPALPPDVMERTSEKYREAYRVLTGKTALNWIDLLLLMLVIGASVLTGFAAGFARVGVGFIAMIVGMFCGFWFYGIVAAYVHGLRQLARDRESDRLLRDLVGGADCWAPSWGASWRSFSNGSGLSWLDRLLGGAFGLVRGFVIAAAMVTVLLAFCAVAAAAPRWWTPSSCLT